MYPLAKTEHSCSCLKLDSVRVSVGYSGPSQSERTAVVTDGCEDWVGGWRRSATKYTHGVELLENDSLTWSETGPPHSVSWHEHLTAWVSDISPPLRTFSAPDCVLRRFNPSDSMTNTHRMQPSTPLPASETTQLDFFLNLASGGIEFNFSENKLTTVCQEYG